VRAGRQAHEDGRHAEVPTMLSGLVAMVGVALLLVLAVCIGAALDPEVQRPERRRFTDERRRRWNARRRGRTPGPVCDRCPYRE
jgi:hypothetical protein